MIVSDGHSDAEGWKYDVIRSPFGKNNDIHICTSIVSTTVMAIPCTISFPLKDVGNLGRVNNIRFVSLETPTFARRPVYTSHNRFEKYSSYSTWRFARNTRAVRRHRTRTTLRASAASEQQETERDKPVQIHEMAVVPLPPCVCPIDRAQNFRVIFPSK